ncbi:MAG: RNA polymerase sigma-70 factor [Bacteroidetes bacterium]|nr:RNA polymerase sigma-70 factor [Bacteroidota bacterium]
MADVSTLGDVDLTDLLKSGDHAAFTEIYHRYKGLLYIFAYKRVGDREEARDIIHELFTALWEKREALNITGNLLSYLYTSVRNRIMDRVARQKVAARYLDQFQEYIDSGHSPADHLARMRNLEELIEREIAALPPKMRTVFLLSRNTELSRKEIAEQLDLSEETVKSHMHHALKTLKGRLGPLFVLLFILH